MSRARAVGSKRSPEGMVGPTLKPKENPYKIFT